MHSSYCIVFIFLLVYIIPLIIFLWICWYIWTDENKSRDLAFYYPFSVFLHGSVSKESDCSAEDLGSIPGSGGTPVEENSNSLQSFYLENPMGRGACVLQLMGSQRIRHNWSINAFTFFEYHCLKILIYVLISLLKYFM